jgi:hypothetical protein
VKPEEESLPSCGKFLEGDKPEVNFVGAGDVFSQPTLISVFEYGVFVVTTPNGVDDLMKFFDLRMHDAKVTHQAHFFNFQPTSLDRLGHMLCTLWMAGLPFVTSGTRGHRIRFSR